jgi:hypothetical protein
MGGTATVNDLAWQAREQLKVLKAEIGERKTRRESEALDAVTGTLDDLYLELHRPGVE